MGKINWMIILAKLLNELRTSVINIEGLKSLDENEYVFCIQIYRKIFLCDLKCLNYYYFYSSEKILKNDHK